MSEILEIHTGDAIWIYQVESTILSSAAELRGMRTTFFLTSFPSLFSPISALFAVYAHASCPLGSGATVKATPNQKELSAKLQHQYKMPCFLCFRSLSFFFFFFFYK